MDERVRERALIVLIQVLEDKHIIDFLKYII